MKFKASLVLLLSLSFLTGCGNDAITTNTIGSSSSTTIEPKELAITSQPKDAEVEIPNGCSFTVEVNSEKLVKSYMWQVYNGDIPDGEGPLGPTTSRGDSEKEQWLDLKDCSSAYTKTYIKMSTFDTHNENKYRCKITDINDKIIYTDEAHLTYSNPGFNEPMVKVGGYVLLVGQSLDLSNTELGTGVISYVSRTELKLSNLRYHNELPISDNLESGTDGIMVHDETFDEENFKVTLEGDNVIHNSYWDPNYNAGGIGLNFFFGDGYLAQVDITGEGKLAITGGSHAIYCPGTLHMETDLILNSIGSHYNSGIYANSVILDGAKITGKVNGPVIVNKNYPTKDGTIYVLNDSFIDVTVCPQHPSVGGLVAEGITSKGEFKIDKSTVNIDMVVSGEDFDQDHSLLGAQLLASTSNYLIVTNSSVKLTYQTDKDTEGLATTVYGICGESNFSYSDLYINIDSEETTNAACIAGDSFTALECDINLKCLAKGVVYGILANERSEYSHNNINVTTQSYDTEGYSFGVIWTNITVSSTIFNINTTDGVAYATLCKTSTTGEYYFPTYTPKYINKSKFSVLNLSDATVNQYSIYFEAAGKYNVIETIYSLSDTTKPASSLILNFW